MAAKTVSSYSSSRNCCSTRWAGRGCNATPDAVTRVLVDTSDGTGSWTTVGVHGNVVEASWLALLDAMTYVALRHDGVAAR